MSVVSKWLNRSLERFKSRMRDQCRSPETVAAILAYPPLATWLGRQSLEVRPRVAAAIPLILEFMADKWFGG
ncbi:MAG TPA: hypothetical protein VMY87_12110 [Armatimonadota bacterium]|nr:hypothetical protein [Armatimonadota bacterium]